METEMRNPGAGISTLARVGLIVAAATAGLILTLTIIIAVVVAQTSNFDSSYKTGPRFAETGEVITYTIVAVNAGGPVTDVLLSDPVPNGVVFVPGSCVYRRPAGGAVSCNPPPDLWQEDFATGDRITTTFAVQVTAGSMNWPLVNCAYLNWDSNQKEMCFTTTVNPSLTIYLPLVMRNFPPRPDLRVVSLTVEPGSPAAGQPVTITVEVQNVGGADAGPFWVDLYDNPDPPPTHANQPFDQLCSGAPEDCYGIAWYVDGGLNVGQSVALTSVTGTMPDYSRWPGYFVESGIHDVYAFADSWNDPAWYGAVLEQNEGLDNRYGPVSINVAPAASRWSVEPVEQDDLIPVRPNHP